MNDNEKKLHIPVLANEVLEVFAFDEMNYFIDATVGLGGHAELLLSKFPNIKEFIGIDQDPNALDYAKKKLKPWEDKVRFIRGNFYEVLESLVHDYAGKIDGILIDLGVSSIQLDQGDRGFSFQHDGSLDMRMDPDQKITAKEIVNSWSQDELGKVFKELGEVKEWRKVAREIVKARNLSPIETTFELVQVVKPCIRSKKPGIHPATKVFQALRLAVNRELEVIEKSLPIALKCLRSKGRCAVISFHSLEDRIVKRFFRYAASDKEETTGIGGVFRDKEPMGRLLYRKPIMPKEDEILKNPRSRSAKMRCFEKR